jgi:nucleotide-binding universal stress UspA family protein
MNCILVPFDFSHNSRNALAYAARLAKLSKAELVVLHAYDRAAILEGMTMDGTKAGMEKERHHLEKHHELPASIITTLIREGELIDEVSDFLKERKVDLVVMGTRGASGLQEVLVGSRTVAVMSEIYVPMLVVPESAEPGSVRNILLCSDLKEVENDNNLDLVKELAMLFGSAVRIAHVEAGDEVPTYEQELERRREKGIFSPEVEVTYKRIKGKTVLEGIRYYLALKDDNDLVVMINRKHGFIDSLFRVNHTHKMAYHTTLPLLVLPEGGPHS